jgi:hypothetical protein
MSSPFSQKFHAYGKDPIKMLGDLNKDGKMSGWEQARQDKIESNSPGKMLSPFNKKEPAMDPCSAEFDYEVATDAGMTAKQIREARKKCKDNSETEESSAKRDVSMSRGSQGERN